MATIISSNQDHNSLSTDLPLLDLDDIFSPTLNHVPFDMYDVGLDSINEDDRSESPLPPMDNSHSQDLLTEKSEPVSETPTLECRVCSAPARGYNFDQITCESCKAFFRRNAFRSLADVRCRFSGSCDINTITRRHCTYCRLKKCFDIKMRKDWIRTEEEKQLRKLKRIEKEKRKASALQRINQPARVTRSIILPEATHLLIASTDQGFVINPIYIKELFGVNRNISNEDHTILNNITNAYQSGADHVKNFNLNHFSSSQNLVQFMNKHSQMHESLIFFSKGLPHFKQLSIDDQILLIKRNLVTIVHLHYILMENFQESPLVGVHMSKWIDEEFHNQMSRTRRYFDRFIEHPIILKLALVVLLFSVNLSATNAVAPCSLYKNRDGVLNAQDFYTVLLWRYLSYLFGERQAVHAMTLIVTKILRYQLLMNIMDGRIRSEANENPCNQLIHSLFQL